MSICMYTDVVLVKVMDFPQLSTRLIQSSQELVLLWAIIWVAKFYEGEYQVSVQNQAQVHYK